MISLERSSSWIYAVALHISGNTTAAAEALMAYRDRLLLKTESTLSDYYTLVKLGLVYALLNDEKASLDAFDKAISIKNNGSISSVDNWIYVDRAIALAWIGRKDEAVAEFERLIKEPSELNVHVMRHCLDFWPLRDHPGFQAILDDPANSQPLDLDKL